MSLCGSGSTVREPRDRRYERAVETIGVGREPALFGVLMSLQGGGRILGGVTAVLLIRRLGEARPSASPW
ncbi:MAG: hypothetical protein WKF47_16350 [Geodermatophilaceae bacterium]